MNACRRGLLPAPAKASKCGCLLLAAAVLGGCATAPVPPPAAPAPGLASSPLATLSPPDLATGYQRLAGEPGIVYRLDPARSQVRILAFRAGPAARFGHNHVLTSPAFQGFVHMPPGGAAPARMDLVFRLDALAIDEASQRAALGAGFAGVVDEEAKRGTREHMLGEDNLQAERFPFVTVHSVAISGEAPVLAARVLVGLHGVERECTLPVRVEGLPGTLRARGSLVLRQSDFGVKPYSAFGGLISVADEVVVEFEVVGEPFHGSPTSPP